MRVVVAGTFGPLHDGHRALLETALAAGDEGVVVGLTTDAFATSTRERSVPPYEERERALRNELAALDRWDRETKVVPLEDEYGVAITDPPLDAIVVSEETAPEVADVNRRREEAGMDPLEPIVVPLVAAADGERISSTRVVRGEIDEHGHPAST